MCTPSTGAIVEGEREAKAKNPFCAIWHHFPLLSFRICQRKTERADGRTDGRTDDRNAGGGGGGGHCLQDEE